MLSKAAVMWNRYLGFGVLGFWCEVCGSRFRVYGAGFRFEGLLRLKFSVESLLRFEVSGYTHFPAAAYVEAAMLKSLIREFDDVW
jgi:hypothetical protein